MSAPRLLDLFSGAGGAARGYQLAGFHVTGVDNRPQPRYCGDAFVLADALEYVAEHGREYDAIHASPPCQHYTQLRRLYDDRKYPDLLGETRQALLAIGRPWVIENVVGSPVYSGIRLCGTSFGLNVRRHRYFESSVFLLAPGCIHTGRRMQFRNVGPNKNGRGLSRYVGVYGHTNYAGELAIRRAAMGIDWMSADELSQAIPPAFTTFVGAALLAAIGAPA